MLQRCVLNGSAHKSWTEKMKSQNDYSLYEYLKMRDKGDDRTLISFYNIDISTNFFFAEVDRVANALYALGVKTGDSISLCLANIPNALIVFYGANKIGVGVNLIHPLAPPKALGEMVKKLNSKVVFVMDIFFKKHEQVLSELNVKTIVCRPSDYLKGLYKFGYNIGTITKYIPSKKRENVIDYLPFLKQDFEKDKKVIQSASQDKCLTIAPKREHFVGIGEEIAAFIHSGGTTGLPKTAMLSNRAINECAYSIRTLIGDNVPARESMLMVLPMFHIFGLGVCMHATLTAGGRSVLVPVFKPKSLAKVIRKQKINYMTGVPSMYKKLIKVKAFGGKHLQSMKCCYCGGDKLNEEIKNDFDAFMKKYNSSCTLCEGYGLTEAGICNVNVAENSKVGSVGTSLGDIKACIMDKDKNKLSANERGEICLSGDSLMSGYYGDEQTTKQVLFKDDDGKEWVATGDYGYIDKSGHLFFVDRIKRMVKISGMNVFPSEIETLVTNCVEQVDKCCAVDILKEGKPAIKLFVQLKEDKRLDRKFDANQEKELIKADILQVVGENLMKYSLPREIEFVKSLPITEIGKVDYKKLKERNLNDNK